MALGRDDVRDEHPVGDVPAEFRLPGVEILSRVGVHRLVVAAVEGLIADQVTHQAAAQPALHGSGGAHFDRPVDGSLVDPGLQAAVIGAGPRLGDVHRQHVRHDHQTRGWERIGPI